MQSKAATMFQCNKPKNRLLEYHISKIMLRQTQENCWEVVLTEEERELIDEFLEI